jgi:hypothetical protein
MKSWNSFLLLAIVLSLVIFPIIQITSIPDNEVELSITRQIQNQNIPSEETFSLTWSSRWSSPPQNVTNESDISGDHIVLNATFPDSLNITHSSMIVENGFRLNTTRALVIPSEPWNQYDGIINHTEFDWVIVKGVKKGLPVKMIGNFTNSDTDFMAWSGDTDYSQFANDNNLVNMATGYKPETDEFLWESDNDTLYIGCLNYDSSPGNWTLDLQVGVYKHIRIEGNSVIYDTYTLDRRNQTVNIRVEGKTESNYTLVYEYVDVILGNFFTPSITVNTPTEIEPDIFNITWNCQDKNDNDTNYFSVWLSGDDGASYQLLVRNLTRTYYIWNSAGFLEKDDYVFRVRAFSVDLVSGLASVDSEANYWPGDFSDAFSPDFVNNHVPPPPPPNLVLSSPTDIAYYVGETGNYIKWVVQVDYEHYLCLDYEILIDGEIVRDSCWEHYWDRQPDIQISVDNQTIGEYTYLLQIENPGPDGGIMTDTVIVKVMRLPTPVEELIIGGFLVVGVGFTVLVIVSSLLKNRRS